MGKRVQKKKKKNPTTIHLGHNDSISESWSSSIEGSRSEVFS
jgi:hypothetical protein